MHPSLLRLAGRTGGLVDVIGANASVMGDRVKLDEQCLLEAHSPKRALEPLSQRMAFSVSLVRPGTGPLSPEGEFREPLDGKIQYRFTRNK